MTHPLETEITALGAIAKKCARPLKRLGILTVGDLLRHLPFRYDDLSRTAPLERATSVPVTVRVRIDMIEAKRSAHKKMMVTKAVVSDEQGRTAEAVWFRQPFVAKMLKPGDMVRLSAKIEARPWGLTMVSPAFERETSRESVHTGRIVPVYPTTGGMTVKQLRALLHDALPSAKLMEEDLPDDFLDTHDLLRAADAYRAIHFPETLEEAEAADRRFRFDELLRFQLKGALARQAIRSKAAHAIPFSEEASKRFVASLPFSLTDDQKRAAWQAILDMGSGRPMHRLLEGDVGSGKTAVAAVAMQNAAEAGYRSLMMAPTEILAEQHYRTVAKLFAGTPHGVALRTRTHKDPIGDAAVVIGTHALLSEGAGPLKPWRKGVGLVVVDEQHRFGVAQRAELLKRLGDHPSREASGDQPMPHFLSMTATPIPRTLALALFGDVDFTALRQMPAGRKPVQTMLVDGIARKTMLSDIRKQLELGHKVFVVCPLIEESDDGGMKSAEAEAARLREETFGAFGVGLLHGKMKPDLKRETMERFANGDLGVLVATTVVEVGVDVPRATVMVIEGAERFGLAQLHQLRGRVGRSDLPSSCYLAVSDDAAPASRERLEGFCKAKDCFEIAELDLKTRGMGDLFGQDQSGFGDLKRFRPSDVELIQQTRKAAEDIVTQDPGLNRHPHLKAVVASEAKKVHLE